MFFARLHCQVLLQSSCNIVQRLQSTHWGPSHPEASFSDTNFMCYFFSNYCGQELDRSSWRECISHLTHSFHKVPHKDNLQKERCVWGLQLEDAVHHRGRSLGWLPHCVCGQEGVAVGQTNRCVEGKLDGESAWQRSQSVLEWVLSRSGLFVFSFGFFWGGGALSWGKKVALCKPAIDYELSQMMASPYVRQLDWRELPETHLCAQGKVSLATFLGQWGLYWRAQNPLKIHISQLFRGNDI